MRGIWGKREREQREVKRLSVRVQAHGFACVRVCVRKHMCVSGCVSDSVSASVSV